MKTGIQRTKRDLVLTRLETWAMPGIPDLVICDERGNFHFVELKATAGNSVDLRPHQVAWLSKHKHASVWVLVKKMPTKSDDQKLYLFHGRKSVDLKMEGLKVEPDFHCGKTFLWDLVLDHICPN
jgi:hypothetical protein